MHSANNIAYCESQRFSENQLNRQFQFRFPIVLIVFKIQFKVMGDIIVVFACLQKVMHRTIELISNYIIWFYFSCKT